MTDIRPPDFATNSDRTRFLRIAHGKTRSVLISIELLETAIIESPALVASLDACTLAAIRIRRRHGNLPEIGIGNKLDDLLERL